MSRRRSKYSLEKLITGIIGLSLIYFVLPNLFLSSRNGFVQTAGSQAVYKSAYSGIMENFYQTAFSVILLILPILFFLVIFIIITGIIIKTFRDWRLAQTGILEIDAMSGQSFEARLVVLFRNLGYRVKRTGKTGDAGVDLIIEKSGIKTAVQAKRYQGNIGESAVQEVHTGKDYYRCDKAMIVSNSEFTTMAHEVAQKTGIELWGREDLIKALEKEKGLGVSNFIHEKPVPSEVKTDLNKQAVDPTIKAVAFIMARMKAGDSWRFIKEHLMSSGWKDEELEEIYVSLVRGAKGDKK